MKKDSTYQTPPKLNPEAIMGKQTFNERLIDVIPFIDPDSTRMVEWIWAVRHKFNKSTFSKIFKVPQNLEVKIDEIVPFLKDKVETFYHSDHYFRAIRMNKVDDYPELLVVVGQGSSGSIIVAAGEENEVTEIYDYYQKLFIPPKVVETKHLMGFSSEGKPVVKEEFIKEDEIALGTDEFYPWIEEGIDKFVADFKKSKSNVVLLIGDPGTGKSTFLRTVLFKLEAKHVHLAYNEMVLLHNNFSNWLESIPKKSVIGIEDADNFVSPREGKNYQMSALLNYIEGVIPTNNKLIISTNLQSTNKVDPALIRVGRNFRVLEFKELTRDQANKARKSVGLPELDFLPEHKKLTLALALNYENVNPSQMIKHKRQGVGFLSHD